MLKNIWVWTHQVMGHLRNIVEFCLLHMSKAVRINNLKPGPNGLFYWPKAPNPRIYKKGNGIGSIWSVVS